MIQFVPGGPVEQLLAEARAGQGRAAATRRARDIDAKQIEELKKLYGFDKPAHVRYVEMLGNFARFDLGRSFLHNKDGVAADQGEAAGVDQPRRCGPSCSRT